MTETTSTNGKTLTTAALVGLAYLILRNRAPTTDAPTGGGGVGGHEPGVPEYTPGALPTAPAGMYENGPTTPTTNPQTSPYMATYDGFLQTSGTNPTPDASPAYTRSTITPELATVARPTVANRDLVLKFFSDLDARLGIAPSPVPLYPTREAAPASISYSAYAPADPMPGEGIIQQTTPDPLAVLPPINTAGLFNLAPSVADMPTVNRDPIPYFGENPEIARVLTQNHTQPAPAPPAPVSFGANPEIARVLTNNHTEPSPAARVSFGENPEIARVLTQNHTQPSPAPPAPVAPAVSVAPAAPAAVAPAASVAPAAPTGLPAGWIDNGQRFEDQMMLAYGPNWRTMTTTSFGANPEVARVTTQNHTQPAPAAAASTALKACDDAICNLAGTHKLVHDGITITKTGEKIVTVGGKIRSL